MSQGYKICPICGTHAHRNATLCSTCGTSLTDVPVQAETAKPATDRKPRYDHRYGETDLLEGDLHRRSGVYLFSGILALVAVACVGAIIFFGVRWLFPSFGTPPTDTPTALAATLPIVLITNTPPPSPVMATVTPPPPTPTITPTPGPCTHKVQSGDDLITIAFQCGHRSLDVIPLILTLNNLSAPDMINVGQEIVVPWPTATPEANGDASQGDSTTADSASAPPDAAAALVEPTDAGIPGLELAAAPTRSAPTQRPTATLLPGVTWHIVQPNENIVAIAFEYNTDVQALSQLNPEITFSQCDFGNPAGGPDCMVMIYEGQQMRVPAPTPTPTLSPTLSGSETALPTFTPTYNAPSALSPADHTLFMSGDLVTLRWVGSGTLGAGDAYRVRVEDLTTRAVYTADTTELSFILPQAWQGQDAQRHEYRWMISIIRSDDPDRPYYTTRPRLFTWEGR